MKNADLTLIVAKWRTLISFLVHLTGDELSKKGRQKGVWVNYLLVWDWWFIMPEWNLSSLPGDSLIYQNQTQALTIGRRSWKQRSDGLVLIKGWLVGTAGTPCCYSIEFHCGHLNMLFFFSIWGITSRLCAVAEKWQGVIFEKILSQIPSYIHANGSIYCPFLRTGQLVFLGNCFLK